MYKIDYKNIKKGRFIAYPFIAFGVIMFSIVSWINLQPIIKKNSMDSKVEAINVDKNCHYSIDRHGDKSYTCSPIYTYEVNGQTYECRLNHSTSKEVTKNNKYVYYDSNNPKVCVTDYQTQPSLLFIVANLFPLLFVAFGVIIIVGVNKKIKKVNYLSKNGILIKNLKYTLEPTGEIINNRTIVAPAVDYTLSSGVVVHLKGYGRYDGKFSDEDGFVDLLIDPNDINNYFIDFNITSENEDNQIKNDQTNNINNVSNQNNNLNIINDQSAFQKNETNIKDDQNKNL